ncbi:hypothetical protein [Nocardia sp. NPDC002869]|uniref:hypothetical protein n=1 Tax=Nocardia sp. NPDC002869 TaxID=3161032 RepID=UPI00398C87E5
MSEPARGSLRARYVRQLSALTARRLTQFTPVNTYTLPAARALIDQALRAAAPPLAAPRQTGCGTARSPVNGSVARGQPAPMP